MLVDDVVHFDLYTFQSEYPLEPRIHHEKRYSYWWVFPRCVSEEHTAGKDLWVLPLFRKDVNVKFVFSYTMVMVLFLLRNG